MFKEFLTKDGEKLIAESIAGRAKIQFTKMEIGSGEFKSEDNNITRLLNKELQLDIYEVAITEDNCIKVTTILKSDNIGHGFYLKERALFATDGENEYMVTYGTSGESAEFLDNSGGSKFDRVMRTFITLSPNENVNIVLQDGIYASNDSIEKILKAISELSGWSTYTQVENDHTNIYNKLNQRTQDLENILWQIKNDSINKLVEDHNQIRNKVDACTRSNVWTDQRAAALDVINNNTFGLQAIYNLLASGIGSPIKRIIHGCIKAYTSYSIEPPVNGSKTMVLLFGSGFYYVQAGTNTISTTPTYNLTDNELTIYCDSEKDREPYICFQIIEFN